jgi:hypothetical protein
MFRTCPWCLEGLPIRHPRDRPCPACGRELVDDDGRELTAVDLRFDSVEAQQCERFAKILGIGTIVAAGAALAVPFIGVFGPLVIALGLLAHLILVRAALVGDSMRLLRPGRRLVGRWLTRLVFLWGGGLGYGAAMVPLAGVVPAAGTFALLTAFVHHYSLWSLRRDRDRRGASGWETALLVGLAVLTLILLVVGLVLGLVVGWSISHLVAWIQGLQA